MTDPASGPEACKRLAQHRTEWIVYAAFVSIVELARGSYSPSDAAFRVGITAALAWYLIRELQQRSSLVWAFGVVFGVTGTIRGAYAAIDAFRDSHVACLVLALASVAMHVRMFRILRERTVKQFVMSD